MTPTNLNPLLIDQIVNFAHLVRKEPQTKEQFLESIKTKYAVKDCPKAHFFYLSVERSEFETIRLSDNRSSVLFNQ
jgi:hypothetical protein